MVNVEPFMSSAPSFFDRAAPASSVTRLAMPRMFSESASLTTGTTRPCWSRSTAMPRFTYGCSVIVLASMSIEELTVGNARSASMVALDTNGRYDRDAPVSFLNWSLNFRRTLSTLSKSTSTEVHTDAEAANEAIMPPATARRIRDSVTISSRGSDTPAGTATLAAGLAAAGAAGAGAAGAAGAVGAAAGAGGVRVPPLA